MILNSQTQLVFICFTLLGHIASTNNVVVTVLQFIVGTAPTNYSVWYIVKNPKLRRRIKSSLSTAIYGNTMFHCLFSRSQRLIGFNLYDIGRSQ